MKRTNYLGFTIIELLIATSIFSVVLLVALNGFFQIGKLYYKGVATSQTQATAQKIMEDMSSSLQFASVSGVTPPPTNPVSGVRYFMCIGDTRYTYIIGNQVTSTHDFINNFGLLRDYAGCGDPFSGGPALKDPVEMLGAKMRLSKICLFAANGSTLDTSGAKCGLTTPQNNCDPNNPAAPCLPNLWLINLKVTYGDDNILLNPSSQDPSCNASLSNSQYCSVANLQTVINRGYGN